MSQAFPMVTLGNVLKERLETPADDVLASGAMRVVAKIGFNDGKIELRTDSQTKTKMILIRPGDLVVSGINAYKGAIAVYGEENHDPIAATIHYGAYIPNNDRIVVSYLWWLLRSATFRSLLEEYVPGGIKTELKAKRLLPIPIPLPPLPEQRRIVARVEELAAKIEEASGLRRRAAEEADLLVACSIRGLLDGKPSTGRLGDVLLENPRNGWSARCDNFDTGVPVLTLASVTGFRYRPQEFKRTSEPTRQDAHYWLCDGDLLITRSNTPDLVGHAAIYNGSPSPCIYPDLMMTLRVNEDNADKRFVHYWLRSSPARDHIRHEAKGTSPSMKKISQGTVINIPFPSQLSLAEQRRIVVYVDDLQAKVDSLKRLQAQTSAELDPMLPSILDKAFRGEL